MPIDPTRAGAAATAPLAIATINAMTRQAFVDAFGAVFEHSPGVAEAAWSARPFADADALHGAMMAVIRARPVPDQVAFLCKHPELAGREATEGDLTAHSESEQASAGLNRLTVAELARMASLNEAYRTRHGFPFIACVRHYTKAGIFAEFERRIARDTAGEREEALAQIGFITRLRLSALTEAAAQRRAA
jgi:2-oxo-4-hydroxy-4-carboxy-5-ureidoimidazoline decarboxylase